MKKNIFVLPVVIATMAIAGCTTQSQDKPTSEKSEEAVTDKTAISDESSNNTSDQQEQKLAALELGEQIDTLLYEALALNDKATNAFTQFTDNSINLGQLSDQIAELNNLKEEIINVKLEKLKDSTSNAYVSACQSIIRTMNNISLTMIEYLKVQNDETLIKLNSYMEKGDELKLIYTQERNKYFLNQGFSEAEVKELFMESESISNDDSTTNTPPVETPDSTIDEKEVYNYLKSLLNTEYSYPEPTSQELADYFNQTAVKKLTADFIESNKEAYLDAYYENKHDEDCTKQTAEKFGLTVDEVNHIWARQSTY